MVEFVDIATVGSFLLQHSEQSLDMAVWQLDFGIGWRLGWWFIYENVRR
jgi:hypothetical protein